MVEAFRRTKELTDFSKRKEVGEQARQIYDSEEVDEALHNILVGKADQQIREIFWNKAELVIKKGKFAFSFTWIQQGRMMIGRYPLENGSLSKNHGIRLTFVPDKKEIDGEEVPYYKMSGIELRGTGVPRSLDRLEVLDKARDIVGSFAKPQQSQR